MDFLYRLLPPRPSFAGDMSPAEAEVMQRHVAYWEGLLDREVALAFGPVLDPERPWGLGIVTVPDEPAGRAIADEDPAVASGVCSYDLVPMQLVRRG
jgi:hypothetical protein